MKATSTKKDAAVKPIAKEKSFPVVAIGASAGGLEAMIELLSYLQADTGMAFIYVQHLSPDHKSLLTEILSKKTRMKVQEIDDMDKIKPDNIFVIPYNKGIEVTDGHIKLIPRSENSTAVSIDILFSSLAEAQKERVIGVVLSGSASDGTMGIKAIKQNGGLTFAQDDSAKFTGMPHSAIASGAVDFILSPKEIALELSRLSEHPLVKSNAVKNGEEDLIDNNDPDLKTVINQLLKVTGVNFGLYKMNTIKRRIIRRMVLNKIATLNEYAKLLSQRKEEIDILYQDLLINVTSFFRDTDTHNYLKATLLPKLLKRKKAGESLRIWVPACATGEEAYSIAMMLLEIQGSQTTNITIQIFATDLSEQSVHKARLGVYSKQDLETVSPKRIQRFFTKIDNGFRVNKAVRDMCVFAPHNILRDPPFSRLDFISCCNLFIYFDTLAQKKAINTFHYALNDDGYLMLGKSESISQSANLFTAINKKYKIFARKLNSGNRLLQPLSPRYTQQNLSETTIPTTIKNVSINSNAGNQFGLDHAIDSILISDFMPASVVINYQMEIVQFRGATELFLLHPKGKATFNILKMAQPEIAFDLRNTISKSIKNKSRVLKSGIELRVNSIVRIISLEILPLNIEWDEPLLLVVFKEQDQIELFSQQIDGGKKNTLAKDRRIKKLEEELAAAHADSLMISQQQEAFAEELQSANEEVVSSNEELQTVNEELETSKEEIESANEELTTTNQELQTRNDLLSESYEYSEAVIATLHNPMIVLDKNLRVKSANETFCKMFNVKEEETEGQLLYDIGNKQWDIPRLRELLEEVLPEKSHFHDVEITHTFPSIGEKIMLFNANRIIQKTNRIELILLAIADVTEVRKKATELQVKENEILLLQIDAERTLRKTIEDSEKRYNMMVMQSPFAFAVLKGEEMVIALANDSLKEMWGKGKEIEGKPLLVVMPEIKDQGFYEFLKGVYTTGIPYTAREMQVRLFRHGKIEDVYFNFVYQPYREADETISGVTVIAIEVTVEAEYNKRLKESEEKFKQLSDLLPNKVSQADADGNFFFFNKKWVNYTGLSIDELKIKVWDKVVYPDELNEVLKRWKNSIKTGEVFEMEFRLLNKEGEYRWNLSRATAIKDEDNKVIKWLCTATEIQKQVEQRIELEKAVEKRTTELKAANKELVFESKEKENRALELIHANKELEAFAYISSHDLQEPLRKIQTFAGRILDKEYQNLSDHGKNYFHRMQNAAERMQTLIQDLLAFSRLSTSDRKFQNTDLKTIIEEVKLEFKEAIEEKKALIEVKEICEVHIIPFQFRQLMHNLIGNALKFSNPNIPPHIVISSVNIAYSKLNIENLPIRKEYCHISISDNGIGFEKEFAEKIFEVFQKLHGKDEYAGTGIGLAIVKKIIENHGGIITAKSKLNEGATFDIYIPTSQNE